MILTGLTGVEFGGVWKDGIPAMCLNRACRVLLGRSLERISSETISRAV